MGHRLLAIVMLVGLLDVRIAESQDLKPIKTQRVQEVTVTLLNETGRWKVGKNSFVLDFTSADKKPVEVIKASVSTSMAMAGMAPMLAGATLQPDGPGRYRGTINFPDAGDRQVTINWEGPGGRSSTRFSVPVR